MALFPLGILSAAGAGGAVAVPDFELITTTVLGSTTPSVTFSSLGDYSSTYKHLQIRMVARNNFTSNTRGGLAIRFNGTTSTYYSHRLYGNGSTVVSNSTNGTIYVEDFPFLTSSGNEHGAAVIDILDAYSTTKNKTIRALGGFANISGFNGIVLTSGAWTNTASITSIKVEADGASIYAGSRFSLYGIKG